jgi:hypothetical protein
MTNPTGRPLKLLSGKVLPDRRPGPPEKVSGQRQMPQQIAGRAISYAPPGCISNICGRVNIDHPVVRHSLFNAANRCLDDDLGLTGAPLAGTRSLSDLPAIFGYNSVAISARPYLVESDDEADFQTG